MLAITLIFESDEASEDDASFADDPQAETPAKAAMATEAARMRFMAVRFVELKNADTDIVPYFPHIA
jgi:hypothetical protein